MAEPRSPGGSSIRRHQPKPGRNELEVTPGDEALIDAVEVHLERCFGETGLLVLHEILSPLVHIDVHVVPPSDAFPAHRLVTSGMAQAPMTVPAGFPGPRFAELTTALPVDWPVTEEGFKDERAYWPVRLLKALARLPHEYSTFLWYGHTIPNGDPPKRYARGTSLCCALIDQPRPVPDGFPKLEVADGRNVRIFAVVPLYKDEMRLKLERGADALSELLCERGITDVVDPGRPSVAPSRRGLFTR